MLNALFTGLGIGLAFWMVVIPISCFLVRIKTVEKTSAEKFNEQIGEAWIERNRLHSLEVDALRRIGDILESSTALVARNAAGFKI